MSEDIVTTLSPRVKSLVGKKFSRWTVLDEPPIRTGKIQKKLAWKCQCTCGATAYIDGGNLKNGVSKSCGCLRHELMVAAKTTHGMSHTHKAYGVWASMIGRCHNPTDKGYHNYGNRGITVSENWRHSFENFWRDMCPTYKPGLTLERIDNSKGYSKENCRWATYAEQSLNTRMNRWITFQGETLTITQWARKQGGSHKLISDRLRLGWSIEKALTVPPIKSHKAP